MLFYKLDKKNIENFINFRFEPLRIKQSVKDLLLIWIFSSFVCVFGNDKIVWTVVIYTFNICISVYMILLTIRAAKDDKGSKFLCEGVFSLYFGMIFVLIVYRVFTVELSDNWLLLALMLLLIPIVGTLLFAVLVYNNVKKGRYGSNEKRGKTETAAMIGAVCGIMVARLIFAEISMNGAQILVAVIFLPISSLLSGIGSMSILKVILLRRINNI